MTNLIISKLKLKTFTSLLIFILLFTNIVFSKSNEVDDQLIKTQKEIRYFKTTTLPLILTKKEFSKIKWKNIAKVTYRASCAFFSFGLSEVGIAGYNGYKAHKNKTNAIATISGDYKKYTKDYFTENITNINEIVLGNLKYSSGVIAMPKDDISDNYKLWQISVPLLIEPSWDRLNDCGDDFSNIKLSFQLFDETGKESAQIVDILPNTKFDSANYGGKATFNVKVGANKRWQAIEASTESKSTFWWNWNPKVLVVASGAAGNNAFCILNKRPDGTGWIGQIPVELLIQAPKAMNKYKLRIKTILMFEEKHKIPLGNTEMIVYLD